MEKNSYHAPKILNISYIITRFLEIASYVLLIIISLVTVGVLFFPKDMFAISLHQIRDMELTVQQITVTVSSLGLVGDITVKWLAVFGGLYLIIALAFASIFFYHLRHLVLAVKQEQPFLSENAKRLYFMGKLTIGASVLMPIAGGLVLLYAFDLVGYDNAEINFMINFTYLFVGFLLIVLGSVFEKGAYLQSEFDQTV